MVECSLNTEWGKVDPPVPCRGSPQGKDLVLDKMFKGAR